MAKSKLDGMYTAKRRTPKAEFMHKGGGEVLVDRSGYRSAKQRIEDLMHAGERLGELRKAKFDFDAGQPLDWDFIDPTRRLDYDLADSTMDMLALEYRRQQSVLSKQEMEAVNAEDKPKENVVVETNTENGS